MNPVVRVSILTIPDGLIEEAADSMRKAEEHLKGAQKLVGLRAYFAGVDRARSARGATFLRPIPNFECLWQWGDIGGAQPAAAGRALGEAIGRED